MRISPSNHKFQHVIPISQYGFFKSSFRFTTKFKGRYRDFLSILCPHISSSTINTTHQNATFVTKNDQHLTHHLHQKSILFIRFHFWCCTSVYLNKHTIYHCNIRSILLPWKTSLFCLFIFTLPPLATPDLFTMDLPFPECHSWNLAACSLYWLASFT